MSKFTSQTMEYVYTRVIQQIKEQKSLVGLCPNRQSILNELFDHCVTYRRNHAKGEQPQPQPKCNSVTNISSLEPLLCLSLTEYQILYFKDFILTKLYEKVVDGSLEEFQHGHRSVEKFLPFSLKISQFLREYDPIIESIELNKVPLSSAMMKQLELLLSPVIDTKEGYWDENSINISYSSSQIDLPDSRNLEKDPDPLYQPSNRKKSRATDLRNSSSCEDNQTVHHITRSQARNGEIPYIPESLTVKKRKTADSNYLKRNTKKKPTSQEDEIWWKSFHAWIQYYDDHGTYVVPENEVVLVDDDDEEGVPLGKWLVAEKAKLENYLQTDPDRYELLAERFMTDLLETEES